MIKAIFFDLDGTLLPIKDKEFFSLYVKLLATKLANHGYEPNKLVKKIQELMETLYKADGSKTCEDIFLELFTREYGDKVKEDSSLYMSFYQNEFKDLKQICNENPLAKEIVKISKEKTGMVVLATNALLPHEGVKTRMSFVDLEPSDFDYISKYENLHYTKPNPAYFLEIMKELNLKGDEIIMFGNNAYEDGECARGAGIKTYLVDVGCIIYPEHVKNEYEIIKFEDIPSIIDKEIELSKKN
jgi:HAD superfamily hydrolase (TIGR01549 family)